MFERKPRSFDRRLRSLVVAPTAVALLIVTTVFIGFDFFRFARLVSSELEHFSAEVAADAEQAILAGDPSAGARALEVLDQRTDITCAYIYGADGALFASRAGAEGANCPAPGPSESTPNRFARREAEISRFLVDEGKVVGTLHFLRSLKDVDNLLLGYAAVQIPLIFLVVQLVLTLYSRSLRRFSEPVMALASTAHHAAESQDYSIRADCEGTGEVRDLAEALNKMLGEIQRRSQELSEFEQRTRAILESIADGIITTNSRHEIEVFNPAAEQMFGYDAEEVIGQNVSMIMPEIDLETRDVGTARYVGTGEAMIVSEGVELRGVRSDGSEFPVELAVSEGYMDDGRMFTATIRDLSERKQAEDERAQLEFKARQSQKMEALGVLAGGIAHDFNNILGVIIGSSGLALKKVPADSKAYTNIERILQAGYRAKDLVKQMLTFSRQTETSRVPIRLDSVVTEVLRLLEASIPAMIHVDCSIDPKAGPVLANETQIHQILMNLCTNAHHAMAEKGGTLTVGLRPVSIRTTLTGAHSELPAGEYVQLSVSDTGCGIDEKALPRIFDPFFSTKGPEGGTGMGLSVVHGIVVDYGGAITVTSTRGRGTRFDVYLPRAEGEAIEDTPTPAPIARDPDGPPARVMIVDDEPALLETAREMLVDLGYAVTALVSSTTALTAFRAQPDRYDVVITDQAMPDMQGTEFARSLLEIRPNLPVILATGYSRELTPEAARAVGIRGYVPKPYASTELKEAISSLLKRSRDEEDAVRI